MTAASTAAELLVDGLIRAGVRCIYGLPGTQNLTLYDAIRRSDLRSVTATDEMAAVFMACGHARATGRLSVVTAIPGPGFTYALTGLAEAQADSAPVLFLTLRQADSGHSFQLQRIDQRAIAKPLVKECFEVVEAAALLPALMRAIECALRGEPGPVLLEVAASLMGQPIDAAACNADGSGSSLADVAAGAMPDMPLDDAALSTLVDAVNAARRPLVFAGQGAQGAAAMVRAWCETNAVPCATTCSGRGVLPESHRLAMGKDFSWGLGETLPALIEQADLVLAMGCKFAHNGTAGFELELPRERLARVDTSGDAVTANYPARLSLVARCEDVMAALAATPRPRPSDWDAATLDAFRRRFAVERDTPVRDEPRLNRSGESIGNFFARLQRALPEPILFTTDSGQNQALTRKYARIEQPRGIIAPTDFQSMGFGLPAAIGAAIARPDMNVVACIGDGGLLQTAGELAVAVRERLSLVVVVFDDGKFGYIERQQVEQYGAASGVALGNVDVAALAEAYGCIHVDAAETDAGLADALRAPGVKLLQLGLSDAASMRMTRLRSAVRAKAARSLGPALRARLRRLRGRS